MASTSFGGRVRVGTVVAPNNTSQRGILSQVIYRQTWTAPATLDVDGHLDAQSNVAAGSTTTFGGALAGVNDVARGVQVVCNDTNTNDVTITGLDQWGNVVTETLTCNGATPVLGKVAFKSITLITWEITSASAVNFDIGTTDVLGLDYKMEVDTVFWELKDQVAATAGTVVVSSSSSNADRRGTVDPNTALNGSLDFDVFYIVTDIDSLT